MISLLDAVALGIRVERENVTDAKLRQIAKQITVAKRFNLQV
jgi:hypothetical protein